MMRQAIGCVALIFAVAGPSIGGDKAKAPIAPAEAKDHVGESVTVLMTVKHAKDGTHRKSFFLDSESDYKDPNNLAVVIPYDQAGAFKLAGIADVVAYYDGKAIQVTGKVVREADQTRIVVSDPKQIEVAAKKAP